MQQEIFAPITVAARSPQALVAYVAALAVWAVIMWKVKYAATGISHIKQFPAKDRIAALETWLGHPVRVKEGLTAEQYLRSRIHHYVFLGFLAVVVALLIVVITAKQVAQPSGRLEVSIGKPVEQPDPKTMGDGGHVLSVEWLSGDSTESEDDSTGQAEEAPPDPLISTSYAWDRRGDTVVISANFPYLSQVIAGEQVTAIYPEMDGYFFWTYPAVDISVTNNAPNAALFTELVLVVDSIQPITEPIPVVDGVGIFLGEDGGGDEDGGGGDEVGGGDDETGIGLTFANDGWGTMRDVMVEFDVLPSTAFTASPRVQHRFPHTIRLPDINPGGSTGFSLLELDSINPAYRSRFIPDSMIRRANAVYPGFNRSSGVSQFWVTVAGVVTYTTPTSERRRVPFRTLVDLFNEVGGGWIPSSHAYSVCLSSSAPAKQEYSVGLSQSVEPGGSDRFTATIGSDKSARYRLRSRFRLTSGDVVPGPVIDLTVLVPANRLASPRRCRTTT